ncbi:Interferon-induced GTP-binding protein Mx [Phytophthora cinnamomi]|uniref:Interferon-induced GTP-binding protein Mx n=1 Tax=Phytophthora cinnamomi TaxID=4785 RepID=UPI00355AB8BB|nr:Interferon-induced GTP-binding protein Mx [Phytophthora cinnamomi]
MTTTTGKTVDVTTRRTHKPKTAGMRKSSAAFVDKTSSATTKTSKKSAKKPNVKSRSKSTSKKISDGGAPAKPEDIQGKNMKWTIQLTALALEARFQNKQILKKNDTKNSNTKAQRAMWEDTINVFQQRALAESAWGNDEPRSVTVKQFKNKLDAVRAEYKTKRGRMLATGNRTQRDGLTSEEEHESERRYPEMPADFFMEEQDEGSDEGDVEGGKLTCDPVNVCLSYLKELGAEFSALWPPLCSVFSHRPGCSGEAITETGAPARVSLPNSGSDNDDFDDNDDDHIIDRNSCEESYESPSEAREKAKAAAKARSSVRKQH